MKMCFVLFFASFLGVSVFSQGVEKEVKFTMSALPSERLAFGNWAVGGPGKSVQVLFYSGVPGFLTYPKAEGVVGQTELISLGGISFYEFSPSLELRTVVGGLVRPEVPLYPGYKAYQLPNRWMGSEGSDRTMAQWGKVLSWAPDLLPLYPGGDVYSVKESEGEVYSNEVSNTLGQLSSIGTEGRRWTVGRGYYKNGYDCEHNLPVVMTEWEWTRKLTFEPSMLGKIQPVFQVGDPKVKQVLFGWDVALSDNKDMGKMFRFAEFRLWSEGTKSWPVLSLTFDYARSVKYAGVAPEGKGYCSIWGTRPFMAAKFCDPSKVGHDFVWSDTNNALVTKTHVDLPIKDRNAGVVYTFGWNDRLNFVFAGTERLSPVYGLVWVDRQGGSGGVAITNDTLKKYLVPSAVPLWADIKTNSYTIESHRVLEDGSLWFNLAGKANSWETVALPDGNTEQRPVSYYVGALFLHLDMNGHMLGVYYVPKSDKKVGFSYSHVIQILSLKDGVMKAVILEPALKKSDRELQSELFPNVWTERPMAPRPAQVGDVLMRPRYVKIDLGQKDVQVKESVNTNFYLENGNQIKEDNGYLYLLGREAGKPNLQVAAASPIQITYVLQKVSW